MSDYLCRIVDWIDGDTAVLDVTFSVFDAPLTIREHARIYGINSPEVHSTNQTEKAAGLASKAFAESLAPIGTRLSITVSPNGWRDKYGRLLAVLRLATGDDFAKTMIAAGMAKPWDGQGPKPA